MQANKKPALLVYAGAGFRVCVCGAPERVAIVAPHRHGDKRPAMLSSVLSALGSLAKLPDLFLSLWRWMQRDKLKVIVSKIEFRPSDFAGAGLYFTLINRTEREVEVSVNVTLESGEILGAYGERWIQVRAIDRKDAAASLVLGRQYKHLTVTGIFCSDRIRRLSASFGPLVQ